MRLYFKICQNLLILDCLALREPLTPRKRSFKNFLQRTSTYSEVLLHPIAQKRTYHGHTGQSD